MALHPLNGMIAGAIALALISGCSRDPDPERDAQRRQDLIDQGLIIDPERETLLDLFVNTDNPNTTVEVNR